MFKNRYIRKPNFKDISTVLDYNDYWRYRGWQLNTNLKKREVVAFEKVPATAKVIDVGCGNSLFPVRLKEKGCDVSVADVSDIVLKGYEEHGITGKILDLETLKEIDDLDTDYDYVVLFEVLEHLKNSEEVVKKLAKHTKHFLITVPNSGAYFYRYGLMFKGRFFTQWAMHPAEHLRYWSHLDFCDWLDALGLEIDEAIAIDGPSLRGLLSWLKYLWKNMFAYRVLYICTVRGQGEGVGSASDSPKEPAA